LKKIGGSIPVADMSVLDELSAAMVCFVRENGESPRADITYRCRQEGE